MRFFFIEPGGETALSFAHAERNLNAVRRFRRSRAIPPRIAPHGEMETIGGID